MTKKREPSDEEILAMLIAASKQRNVILEPGLFIQVNNCGQPSTPDEYPACAVGAGLLYAGLDPVRIRRENPMRLFAETYGVSEDLAWGLSTGFENDVEDDDVEHPDDYIRGCTIGATLREMMEEERMER